MLLSERWLREWVDPPGDVHALAECLTAAGLEVGAVIDLAAPLQGVLVAEVREVRPHPNADRLRLVTAALDADRQLHIVCGAPNVAAGMKAPLATVGSRLPNGVRIKRSRIRGEPSEGMLCSAAELGLSDDATGIMALPAAARPGAPLAEALELHDHLIELELTPNRGDCLSVRGTSRELAALSGAPWTPPKITPITAAVAQRRAISIDAPDDCLRYAGRIIQGIDNTLPSPLWLTERLRRCGIRSLSPAVDVTNYVLLELGQPMHAFDLAKLRGDLRVRRAATGERLRLINAQTAELDPSVLVIADDSGPVALAGIMGGAATEVAAGTTDILLESACFAPHAVAGRARRYKLQTEASHRFERGVDPELQALALERATALLTEIAGGAPGPVVDLHRSAARAAREPITLRAARIERLLGIEVRPDEVTRILESLHFSVQQEAPRRWRVSPPAHRFDIDGEADLIEEVARVHGYHRIEPRLPSPLVTVTEPDTARLFSNGIAALLRARGYHEAITYSFVDRELTRLLTPQAAALALTNPLSADQAVMRTSLWPGLIGAARHNRNRQQAQIQLFEIGDRFRIDRDNLVQETVISAILCAGNERSQWAEARRDADFFDLKGVLEAVVQHSGLGAVCRFEPCDLPPLDPGQGARVLVSEEPLGLCGRLHPGLGTQLGIEGDLFVFELALEPLMQARVPDYKPVSPYPWVRRDLAFELPERATAAALLDCIAQAGGDVLVDARVFDVYAGPGVREGYRSVAIRVTLGSDRATLAEAEVERVIERILDRARQALGARLRG